MVEITCLLALTNIGALSEETGRCLSRNDMKSGVAIIAAFL